jgi:hypothetical protein
MSMSESTPPAAAPEPVNRKHSVSGVVKSVLEKVAVAVITALILAIPFRELAVYIGRHVSAQSGVPVGTVLAYWGPLTDIPDDYELCNGGPPKPGATLRGDKPNLTSRFLRGAGDVVVDARTNPSGRGGMDETPAYTGETDGIALTVAQLPSHQHEIPIPSIGTESTQYGVGDSIQRAPAPNGITSGPGYMTSPVGGGQKHSHPFSVPAHTNLPSYQEIFFIIKVR